MAENEITRNLSIIENAIQERVTQILMEEMEKLDALIMFELKEGDDEVENV